MYLALDFLLSDKKEIFLSEVNIGLPGGAFEYDIAHKAVFSRKVDVFEKIEEISQRNFRKSFRDYIHSLPSRKELKEFKFFMDREITTPLKLHPVLRLEDKWIQYNLLSKKIGMPYTELFDFSDKEQIERLLSRFGAVALKKRTGRWGKGFEVLKDRKLSGAMIDIPYLAQEYVTSKTDNYLLSIRTVSFEGEFVCMSGDLSESHDSKWRYIVFIKAGEKVLLENKNFEIIDFEEMSWEGKIWYDGKIPEHQRLNLVGDKVAKTFLLLPNDIIEGIKKITEDVGKIYMNLDFSELPEAWFEQKIKGKNKK